MRRDGGAHGWGNGRSEAGTALVRIGGLSAARME